MEGANFITRKAASTMENGETTTCMGWAGSTTPMGSWPTRGNGLPTSSTGEEKSTMIYPAQLKEAPSITRTLMNCNRSGSTTKDPWFQTQSREWGNWCCQTDSGTRGSSRTTRCTGREDSGHRRASSSMECGGTTNLFKQSDG